MFVRAERLAQYKSDVSDWRLKPLMLVPDLVVEVVSRTDRIKDVPQKAARYLGDGVLCVWVIDPERQTATIYTSTDQPVTLRGDLVLTGGDLLPGFSLSVRALLEG